jgi:hypothetical protein
MEERVYGAGLFAASIATAMLAVSTANAQDKPIQPEQFAVSQTTSQPGLSDCWFASKSGAPSILLNR